MTTAVLMNDDDYHDDDDDDDDGPNRLRSSVTRAEMSWEVSRCLLHGKLAKTTWQKP